MTKELVDAARYYHGHVPRQHPNGFIQLNLTAAADVRLHVWPTEPLPLQQLTKHPIHDHNFDMESTILRGRLRNLVYEPEPYVAGSGKPFVIHLAQRVPGTESETTLNPTEERVNLITVADANYCGETYRLASGRLHDSMAHGLTATVMTKLSIVDKYQPRVAVPVGVEPDNNFRRANVDLALLWHWIDAVFA